MIQTITELVTFDEFIDWYPENSEYHYELHNGEIIEMPKATGKHSKVTGFTALKVGIEIERLNLPYFIPKEAVIKPMREESGYEPDIIVLNEQTIGNEPRWDKSSIIKMGSSVPLIVEVTSTNWGDDYALKLEAYELMGIQEYWIVDYLGLGGRRFIGNPKQPTFSIYQLVDGEYQVKLFRNCDRIESPTFPELNLTPEQVFAKGK
ncbi:MAG: Uma2 family endonuclease [Oscillatoriales cyanobacterium]|nr:MAG: Uma2 family endonuclease [Oscillatoriales cyanobacterium]TAH25299.1 MAG: Uma2 family endonuclease [Oscillatoriales cyanobacterium]